MSEFDYNQDFNDLGFPWAGHRYFAKDLVEAIEPEIIVELGTWRGTSMFSMLQGIKNKKLKTEFFAIDTWEGDKHAGHYEGEKYLQDINGILKKHYPDCRVNLIRKRFENALDDFRDHTVDILHIDGLHTYEAVKNDYYTWINKVKKNGIVLLHDINEKREDFGVYKFWEDLLIDKSNYCFSYAHSHGLGILTKDMEMSEKIKYLKQKKDDINFGKIYTELNADREFMEKEKLRILRERELIQRELNAIYNSKYWKLKERFKKILGR